MFQPNEPRVVAVLDWELSTLGHPLADVAHSCIAWHTGPDEYSGLSGMAPWLSGVPHESEFLAHYGKASGCTAMLEPFHIAFALFRMAVIMEGIKGRALAGNASSADALSIGDQSIAFARRAVLALESP